LATGGDLTGFARGVSGALHKQVVGYLKMGNKAEGRIKLVKGVDRGCRLRRKLVGNE